MKIELNEIDLHNSINCFIKEKFGAVLVEYKLKQTRRSKNKKGGVAIECEIRFPKRPGNNLVDEGDEE
jgi:hypothetical protein